MEPDELLVAGATRLLDRSSLPLRIRQDLHSLRRQTRRVAANRSGFALLLRAAEYADEPEDALWFPRIMEAELLGRKRFPALPSHDANRLETDANGTLDFCQITHREFKTAATLDDLLSAALVQEFATKQLAVSEATEMRVRKTITIARR